VEIDSVKELEPKHSDVLMKFNVGTIFFAKRSLENKFMKTRHEKLVSDATVSLIGMIGVEKLDSFNLL